MSLVRIERHGPVTELELNRPERHNSLVPELLEALRDAFVAVESDAAVRAVVLTAAGRSFSTGGDVRAFLEAPDVAAYADEVVGLLNEVILTMVTLPVPIVAAVHGMVTGGSLGLVLGSDRVLVTPEASFTPWYSVVGFSPDGGWTAMLPAVIGRARAFEALALNRTITADEAVAWGLASVVVSAEAVRREARAVAKHIAIMVPGSVRHAKARLWHEHREVAHALEDERRRFVEQIVTPEARDGMARFLEK